ncbi:MAG: UPF0182 family protein [Clostridiales Family XIII bacterium]|nr:UPF0182 family protein [Clostridiales Family XIII bacterium]
MSKKRPVLVAVVVIVAILAACFGGLVKFITDYLWFDELGYTSVFLKKLFTQLQIGVPLFLILTALGYFYLKLLKKGYHKKISAAAPSLKPGLVNWITLGMSAAGAGVITFLAVTTLWFELLKFTNSTDFNIADPIFSQDVSFYVFKLQFITQLNQILISIVIVFAVLTVLYYFLLLSLCRPKIFEAVRPGEDEDEYEEEQQQPYGGAFGSFGDVFEKVGEAINRQMGVGGGSSGSRSQFRGKKPVNDVKIKELVNIASNQIIILGVIFFIMVGVNFFLRQFDLLYSQTGVLFGAGFTDINITLWMYRVLIVLSFVAAIFFVIGVKGKKYKTVLSIPVLMVVVGALGTGAGLLVQNLVVSPDEITKETAYLEYNIQFTQNAYDLQNVDTMSFPADNNLTAEDLVNNTDTLANIRINDYSPAKQFYNSTQTIRPYYLFNDVDVDRYTINGEYTQTFLSAREVDETLINQEWINKYLKYTHGYGITLSRVDKVTNSGQPDMMIQDIPPKSQVSEIEITRPEIYFGELTNNYILVKTDEQEYDYPTGEENAWTFYEGNAGIRLNLFNRSLFAIREQSMKLLVSTNINSDSRIIINRNITQRVREIMPYIAYDDNPYIVTVDGKLYWIIDAYTTSTKYPYSEPLGIEAGNTINYIRNSVKVVIDAYNGDTSYYLVDDQDPVANTFMSIYPKLFKPFGDMPEELRAHIRYPAQMLNIQAEVYKRYHVNNVKVFYQGEDLWDISQEFVGVGEPVNMTAQYYIMKLPGEDDVEFINSIPYTPRNKKNMTGLLVARNDGEHYGELILYQLPKSKVVYGPMQIEAQIDQNDTIAKEFSLWKNSGSTYTRGNMFIIPIEDSLVYVEPVYLAAANSSLPEVRRVIVAYGDRIAYESTLSGALNSLFGTDYLETGGEQTEGTSGGSGGEALGTMTADELAQRAREAYENALSASQNGDWATYGRELKQLERYLNELAPQENAAAQEETQEASVDTIK